MSPEISNPLAPKNDTRSHGNCAPRPVVGSGGRVSGKLRGPGRAMCGGQSSRGEILGAQLLWRRSIAHWSGAHTTAVTQAQLPCQRASALSHVNPRRPLALILPPSPLRPRVAPPQPRPRPKATTRPPLYGPVRLRRGAHYSSFISDGATHLIKTIAAPRKRVGEQSGSCICRCLTNSYNSTA